MEDAPDPTQAEEDGGEGHQERCEEGGPVAALLVEDGGNKETESWGHDIEDEDYKCDSLRDISP